MSGWTKGPWTLGDENNSSYEVLLGLEHNLTASFSRYDNNTGQMVISREEMGANGRLCMAAPGFALFGSLIAIGMWMDGIADAVAKK